MSDALDRTVTPSPATSAISSFSSVDIDDTRSLLRRFYYPLTVGAPEGAEGFEFRADVIQLGPLTVGQLGFGAPVTLVAGELDAYHVTIPTAGRLRARHAGYEVTAEPGTAVLYGPGKPVYTLHGAQSAELDVKIERSALEAELSALLGRPVTGPIDLPPTVDLAAGPARSWTTLVRLLQGEIAHPASLVRRSPIAEHLRRSILGGLLFSVPHRYTDELTAPAPAGPPRAVRRVMDAVQDEPERPYTVADLARIAGVSVRSLQEGFRRHAGCTPMAYLHQVRLTRAHETLCSEDPASATVAAVAHRWGFAHLGRFASAYRARFGVCPSQTLRGLA
ncbi:AraC family transcriptional regulator [Couchioplanes caeruleus]|uniref:AraC family transcriptional regulator n=2 Tax=Couchioplanes caeruleus TaxID=56438 RepID=A0A1K0FG05_9ACTN|nr:AraC family transcriptional regulator [Couchioplanes caeruleus]OJF11656.1 AraC family transcriptional regulator [Couchioplanes caeruleus subsp. caeruleus]ROP32268.1 AraC family transcriptional regulator [Couchioplanes caeruleus]